MLKGLFIILLFQSAGELCSQALHLQIPGHVLGMLLLWGALSIRKEKTIPDELEQSTTQLLKYLGLFFIPVCVGVLDYLDLLQKEGKVIIWAMSLGLIVPLTATAALLEWWFRRMPTKQP